MMYSPKQEFCKMSHHNPNILQWFLSFVYVLRKLYVFYDSMFLFFTCWNINHITNFEPKKWLARSVTDNDLNSNLLRWLIHCANILVFSLRQLCQFLNTVKYEALALTVFAFLVLVNFLNNMKPFRAAICNKNDNPTMHLTGFLQ